MLSGRSESRSKRDFDSGVQPKGSQGVPMAGVGVGAGLLDQMESGPPNSGGGT